MIDKRLYAEVGKICSWTESSVHGIMKKHKENEAQFADILQTKGILATVYTVCLVPW